jgi:protocatechuate 3,4-dioxygenase beta subunit
MDEQLTRRSSLLKVGGLLATAAAGWKADRAAAGPGAVSSGALTCVLTPELTEGPYYVPNEPARRNVTEGKPGVPLLLRLSVVDVSTCRPVKGAAVEIWHCDAAGVYSGIQQQSTVGQTFLRGSQRTSAKGVATLQTIYPGWYPGRTVHIHVKVHAGGNVVHTGQLFFPDTVTDAVYKRTPYRTRGRRDMRNSGDSIFVNGGKRSVLTLQRTAPGYTGSIVMGVQRA